MVVVHYIVIVSRYSLWADCMLIVSIVCLHVHEISMEIRHKYLDYRGAGTKLVIIPL